MKKTIFSAIALLFAISAQPTGRTIKDRSDNWLQRENTDNKGLQSLPSDETTSDNLRTGAPTPTPFVPVGNGLGLLLIAAGGYFIVYNNKQQKS